MTNLGPIFLSASVPVEGRRGFETSSPFLVKEAVSALIEVILGRGLLVWGGHPAITPMIWGAAKHLNLPYEDVVQLYMSAFFKDQYPNESTAFSNYIETPVVNGDRAASLQLMRHQMMSDHDFSAAIFVGGMEGVEAEYDLFIKLNPNAKVIPVPSPGGVARELFLKRKDLPKNFENAIDFSYWFYDLLKVDMLSDRVLEID